jgi:hypothetical protein
MTDYVIANPELLQQFHLEYCQAVDNEQGRQLIDFPTTDADCAHVGIADRPGAYLVARWVGEWTRVNP